MVDGDAGKAKLLFVVSWDFGELTNAAYFAQDPAFDSLLLVPPALHDVHHTAFSVPMTAYRSLADVLAAVERFQPEVALFFSGYLFANNGLFTPEELARLVGALRARGCRILTTDNFFGLTGEIADNTFNPRDISVIRPGLFVQTHAILKDCTHLYNVNPQHFVTGDVLLYCHRGMIRPPSEWSCPPEVCQAYGVDPTRPRWTFVLGNQEYQTLKDRHGLAFDDLLADQLYEALEQGRQPVVVGPRACTSAIALRAAPGDDLVLVPFCRHDWFVSLMLDAEYVFYWNLFSNSLLFRILNRLPVFFFDYGHIAEASTVWFRRVAQCYYVGGLPPCLDFNQPLEAEELARRALEQAPVLNAFSGQMLQPPAPAEAIVELLRRPR